SRFWFHILLLTKGSVREEKKKVMHVKLSVCQRVYTVVSRSSRTCHASAWMVLRTQTGKLGREVALRPEVLTVGLPRPAGLRRRTGVILYFLIMRSSVEIHQSWQLKLELE